VVEEQQHGLDLAQALRAVADAFTTMGDRLNRPNGAWTFSAITETAIESIPGTSGASITEIRKDRFRTIAATDALVREADDLQYRLGTGPCVDAILTDSMFRPRDLLTDDRWPEYGRQVAGMGLRSMLSYRMAAIPGALYGLNIYSRQVDAFDDAAAAVGLLLATHGASAIEAAEYRERAHHLEQALSTNRQIGTAIGVLMSLYKVTNEQAFNLLRIASQNTNRKLRDVAESVIDTGTLDVEPVRRRPATASADSTLLSTTSVATSVQSTRTELAGF